MYADSSREQSGKLNEGPVRSEYKKLISKYDIRMQNSTMLLTTVDKEKAEVLYASFTSAFNSRISYPQGTLLQRRAVKEKGPPCELQNRFIFPSDQKMGGEQ